MMASAPASAIAAERPRGFLEFVVEHQRVEGDVASHAAPVQGAPSPPAIRPVEKPTLARAVKCFSPKYTAVRAGFDGRVQLRPVSRRTHDLRLAARTHGKVCYQGNRGAGVAVLR